MQSVASLVSLAAAMHAPSRTLRSLSWALSLLALFVHCTSVAHAQPSDEGRPWDAVVSQLTYGAPSDCPSRATFERRLRARLARSEPDARGPRVALDVRLERRSEGAVGELVLDDGRGAPARRRIEARRCSEAVDALAFVTALLLEQRRRERAVGGRSGEDAGSDADATSSAIEEPPSAGEPEPARQEDLSPREAATAETPELRTEATPSPEQSRKEPEAAPHAPQAATAEAARTTPARRRCGPPPRMHGELTAAALVVSGVAPIARPAAGASAALGVGHVSLRAGVRVALPHTARSDEGAGRFGWWSATAALCAGSAAPTRRVGGALCAAAEVGQLHAEGDDTQAPRRARRTWTAVGPRAQLYVRVLGPLIVQPAVELVVPIARDRFEVGASLLHRVPSLTFRAELALGVRFE